MLRRTLHGCLFLTCAIVFVHPVSLMARVIEQIIASVDGEPYTLSDIKQYARMKMGREFPVGDLNRIGKEDQELLAEFITEKLLEAEIKQAGIKVTEAEIDSYVKRIQDTNRINDEELLAALKREGVTLERYRASVKAEIEKAEIIDRQVRRKVNITSDDIERYYRSNPKKYTTGDRVRLRHILLPLSETASAGREKEVMLKATEIRQRALAGEDFGKLARDYSEGAGAAEGGDIGWMGRGGLLREIEETAFEKLSVGQVSQPVRTSLGIHLIKLEGREPGRLEPLADVSGKVKVELYAKATEERFQKWLKTDLRRRHRVDVKLPGVVFRPEEEKTGTLDSLVASRSSRRNEEPGFLSYLNPLSYIFRTSPMEGEDGQESDQNIVSLFGVPLFVTESTDDVPADPLAPIEPAETTGEKAQESGGFLSSMWEAVNPFSKGK